MKIFKGLTLAICLILLSGAFTAASAGMKGNSIQFSPFFGYYFFEGDQHLESGPTFGASIGYNFTPNVGIEAAANYIDSRSTRSEGHVDVWLYHVDGVVSITNFSDRFVPYVAAGLGGVSKMPTNGTDDQDTIFIYGGGFKYFVSDDVALRADARHVYAFGDPENNFQLTVGATFQFQIPY